jgi:two-component system sensor histidine kinase QseC
MTEKVSLRKRLTWYVVIMLLVVTSLSGIAIYEGTTHEAEEIFSASLVQTARILDGLISRESIETNREKFAAALERGPDAHEYERKLFFAVFDSNGQMLLHSRQAPEIPHQVIASGFSDFQLKGKTWYTFALQSSSDNLLVVVGERGEIRQEISEYIGGGLLLPLLVLLPIILWLLWQIVGVALKPLQNVTDQVLQQNLKQLKTVDAVGVPKEISPLVTALNQMITDLDSAYARERRFVSDASHELRNPLASLLINVDNAIEESRDDAAIESLQSMKTSIKRLSHLVSQLLKLSHFENPQMSREFELLDLGQICDRVVASSQSQADAKSIQLEWLLPDERCTISGVDSLLTSMVSNLVDNAIKFSDPGCRVRLRCYRDGHSLVLAVDDSGAGLDSAEHEKVLGRFYRVGDTNTAGAGLGLSIVKSIAQIHSARIELDESELGGLVVRIRFESASPFATG